MSLVHVVGGRCVRWVTSIKRLRLESTRWIFNLQKKRKKGRHLRLMAAPANNEEECDTKFHCRVFDSMSRDAEMNEPPKYVHSLIYITLTFLPRQMVQLNGKHKCHENMLPLM